MTSRTESRPPPHAAHTAMARRRRAPVRQIANPDPKQTVLRALVKVRLDDGEALLNTRQPLRRIGAVYVAGYGVECALKARICADRNEERLDKQFQHHDLRRLAEATSLWPRMHADPDRFARLRYLESEWFVAMRYAARTYDPSEVNRFIGRARDFTEWLLRS